MAGDVTHPKHGVNSVFSRRDIEIFERWFRCGDPKETGHLDAEGLKRLWTSLQMDVTQMSAKWLIALADDNRNGKLNFGEHKVHAERRAEFIKWARTTFEDDKVVQKNLPDQNEHEEQITYHDASVCPVMNKSTPAISEFSLDQCSFLADWFHRWDMNKDGLLDGHEIQNMFQCLRIPISPSGLHAIVQYFDEDMDGKLNFREVGDTSDRAW
ncbi:hypothetical protein HPB52_012827 [Rhipicephalus sanguineus]|uniref:EF-hand domain-containing protein n=1 Tax=Rhipicephalus sanguineus TaxID=34632 RepID=A0A9D4PW03_RHISA|nr:hypothetical protein HPB52_012827 [Rhipicephalus sanguineus]